MEEKDFNFSFGHLGIWYEKESDAKRTADTLVNLFGFDSEEVPYAWHINDNHFEIIKKPGRGTKGHFSILCDDVVGAKKYLETEKGVVFDENTSHYTEDGVLWKIFAHDEISGYAWHLALRGRASNGH
jgi:2-dehydro-3-deoxyphosphogluconate aldolase/(4S)-4-hydroxy-2-oxoglutarate aldolase